MLYVLSSLPVLPRAFALALLSASFRIRRRPLHTFALVLPYRPLPAYADLLLEVAAPGAQIPIPALKTLCKSKVVELNMHQLGGQFIY
jgi:hypothetical protein